MFADPDAVSGDLEGAISRLPYSRAEAAAIARELPGRTGLHAGPGNTRREFLAVRAPVVHVATHAFADADRPERSRLIFSSQRPGHSADYVFLDLHLWLDRDMPLFAAHETSHVVKDKLMAKFPQLMDVVIHIEPPPPNRGS